MRKIIYFFIMAVMIFSLSGCNAFNHGSSHKSGKTHAAMAISSSAFVRGKSYQIYKDAIPYGSAINKNYKYFVNEAVDNEDGRVTMQLEFEEPFSNDAFVVVDVSNQNVVFGYNPAGSGSFVTSLGNDTEEDSETDTETESESTSSSNTVYFASYDGKTPRLQSYTSLEFSDKLAKKVKLSYIPTISSEDEIVINLKTDGTATLSGTGDGSVPQNDFIWHIDPSRPGEYWTDYDGAEYTNEDELLANADTNEGVFVAHDIRYIPDTLEFSESQTLPKSKTNSEKMYVAYYDDGVNDNEENEYYDDNTYVIAALPMNEAGYSDFDSIKSAMTHSASEAYRNPVLHIAKAGTYRLKGTWNGQIMVDIPDNTVNSRMKTKRDPDAKVTLVLDNVNVKCTVGPALLFKRVYECGPSDSDSVKNTGSFDVAAYSIDDDGVYAGAIIAMADGSVNTFNGTNVARVNNPKLDSDYTSSDLGKYINAQDKACKYDGAFHSRMSIAIGLDADASNATLHVTGAYEGLNSEMHMLVDSGTIRVIAEDDGINVNEDNTSVFTMDGGLLSVTSKYGDGIDSNGYIIFNDAEYLKITAAKDSNELNAGAEGPLDADLGIYMSDSVKSIYKHSAYGTDSDDEPIPVPIPDIDPASDDIVSPDYTVESADVEALMQPVTLPNSNGVVALEIYFDDTKDKNFEKDDEGSRVDASEYGNVFYLEHRVNNFSGVYDN